MDILKMMFVAREKDQLMDILKMMFAARKDDQLMDKCQGFFNHFFKFYDSILSFWQHLEINKLFELWNRFKKKLFVEISFDQMNWLILS